ncbi:MAG TPA: alpha/beta hydrolase [Candidatus Tenderia electrophaga]|uniref:Alpha/beta hydrolase n=1 Tax=Candidatus Tenderia electrophaga TaxID=1748243 RepID=A0A832J9M4_9GAMM|nr:alpha/beta hydrolase [Candidatus Tenderia electrophaga]
MATVESKAFFIDGPSGVLECLAENFDHSDNGIMIVCHPHPQHGGSMDNKVVHSLARAGHALGLATLRFNYRGVGKSEGEYAEGNGETDDLLALMDWLDDHFHGAPVWLAGFSFGAYVAMRASTQRQVQQLITVAPAVNLLRFEGLEPPTCPWLLLQGTADEIVPFDQVQAWLAQLETPPETIFFEGVGHFFHGQLVTLRNSLVERLSPPRS